MNHLLIRILAGGSLCLAAAGVAPGSAAEPGEPGELATHSEPFAVVELYTSEGCSSCPPAEAVLNGLHRDAQANGTRVFTLAFHVDYWNRLGWTDPFSDAAYSDRQRRYAAAFRSRSIYTPQMIVNGRRQFVGSDARRAQGEVDGALRGDGRPSLGVGVAAAASQTDAGDAVLEVRWRVDEVPASASLHLVVVEDGLVTDVPRGENRGRTLRHDGVVRVLDTRALSDHDGSARLALPERIDLTQASVVAFVQDRRSFEVLGAHRVGVVDEAE
ncbi:MAG: DUF1223 domain-containing protein [Planctomycetota bacterium]